VRELAVVQVADMKSQRLAIVQGANESHDSRLQIYEIVVVASNEVFTPLQLAVTAMTFAPSTYVPLRGPTLFEAFPFLNTLTRLFAIELRA
jgi:hypothetical protein